MLLIKLLMTLLTTILTVINMKLKYNEHNKSLLKFDVNSARNAKKRMLSMLLGALMMLKVRWCPTCL